MTDYAIALSDNARAARAHAFDIERALADTIAEQSMTEFTVPVTHRFGDGLYLREMIAPPGAVIVGLIHKQEHWVIMARGDITIVGPGERTRLTGTHTFLSTPGTKRIGMTHLETVWTTIHRLQDPDERDIETIERELFCNDEGEFRQFATLQLEKLN